MARRPSATTTPERPVHSTDEKRKDIQLLERRIRELEEFDPSQQTKRFGDDQVTALQASIAGSLARVFGDRTSEYHRYSAASRLDNGPITMNAFGRSQHSDGADARRYLSEGKDRALALLRQAVKSIEEEIEFSVPDIGMPLIAKDERESAISRKVFIVHGRDDGARESVARFLEKLGFEAIILHEQANRGRTVIEKVEANGDVAFAVVLLTPDDEGRLLGGELAPRVRQNVLLELGYFIGRLGRDRVSAFKRGDVEIPSDFAGVVWQPWDEGNAWHLLLGRELQAAGYKVDWNEVMS